MAEAPKLASFVQVLPAPATAQELYLAAILVELQAIHVLLTPKQPTRQQPGQVELKETAKNTGQRKRRTE
jgi:hypothetical protein